MLSNGVARGYAKNIEWRTVLARSGRCAWAFGQRGLVQLLAEAEMYLIKRHIIGMFAARIVTYIRLTQ